jgi:hypothetical protein
MFIIEIIKKTAVQKDTLEIFKLVTKINGVSKVNAMNGNTDIGIRFVTEKNNPNIITMFKSILSRMLRFI